MCIIRGGLCFDRFFFAKKVEVVKDGTLFLRRL